MSSQSKQYTKWCLIIDNSEVNMPTKEHAMKLGNYLRSFNVPLKLVEIKISIETENGKVRIGGKTKKDYSDLLSPTPSSED